MTSLPPPNYDNSRYGSREAMTGSDPYGQSDPYGGPSALGGDPSSNYGLGGYVDPSGGGQSSPFQQYVYDRQLALQTLQNGNIDPQTRQVWQNYLNELNGWFQKYGSASQESGGVTGANPSLGTGALGQQMATFPIAWQDQTHIVTDEGTEFNYTVNRNDSETRPIEAYQPTGNVVLPSNAVNAKVTEEKDANGVAKVVTISFANGGTRVIRFYGKDLTIQAANPDKIVKDASLTSDVNVTSLDDKSDPSQELQGDQPTRRKDGKFGWDGSEFNIWSRSDGKDKYISARTGAHFHASSNTEYWTVEWDGTKKQYVVKVFDDPTDRTAAHLKETFFADDMIKFKMTFDIDPSHITFKGQLGKGGKDSNEIDTTDPQGKKLAFDAGDGSTPGAGEAPNPNYPKATGESVPHNVNGNNAYYDQDSKVQIHTYYEDSLDTHNITAQDSVDIFPYTQADEVEAVYVPAGDPTGKIQLTYTYTDSSSGTKKQEKYIIDPMATSIDPHTSKISGEAADDPKIKKSGVSNGDYPDGLKDLLKGKKDSDILAALKAAGYDYKSVAEFGKAFTDKDLPPSSPDSKFVKLLLTLGVTTPDKQDKLVENLAKLYPGHKVIKSPDSQGKYLGIYFDSQNLTIDLISKDVMVSPSFPKVDDIHSSLPDKYYSSDDTDHFISRMDSAIQTGDWTAVSKFLGDHGGNNKGDIIRNYITALNKSVGSDPDKLKELLRRIPEDVRSKMTADTGDGDHQGIDNQDPWDTAGTITIINGSFY